jgi:AAHS family 4-hydroxybenzoate transporter-like MFS transporter
LLTPILIFWLPESIRLLALKGSKNGQVAELIKQINPALEFAPGTRFVAPEERPEGFPVGHLFGEGRAVATVLIWIMFFTNLLVLYFCATWMPTVINNTGVSVQLAVIATALFQVGGIVGTLVLAYLIERFGSHRVLAGAYFAAAILIAAIGQAGSAIELIIPAVFAAGFCVVGAQIGANALTATFYPTFIRSTGVGWALGIGRIGSIIGPLLGGMMLSLQWHIPTIFLAGAVPVLIAGIAVFSLGRLTRSAPRDPAAVPAT